MMPKIIGVTDLQRRFKAVFDEVAEEEVPYILTRGSRPQAALVPFEEFQRLKRLEEKEILFDVDRLLRRRRSATEEVSEAEVARDVAAARRAARRR